MRIKIGSYLGLLLLLIGLPMLLPGAAAAAPSPQITVGPHAQYQDLNTALSQAQPNQTVVLEPGVYHTHAVINKPVKLLGLSGAILDGDGVGDVILVHNTYDVTIEGLTIRDSGGSGVEPYAGVKIDTAQKVTVKQVKMQDVAYGVYLSQGSYCTLDSNNISGKANLLPEDRGDGLGFWNSNHNTVTNNYISDVRDGALFEFSSFNHIADNQFNHLRYGLHYMYSNDNDFDHNVFADDVAGATPMYSRRITFTDNVFVYFPGERAYAILLKDADDCVIKNNLIMQSNVAIQLDHSAGNLVQNNTIINCGVAYRVFGTSSNNIFTRNLAQDNVIQVAADYRALPNQWSLNGQGNYWSDYQGYDFTGSGIGAKPYQSVNYLAQAISDQPILELFAESPGLQAVAKGLQLFPLWQLPGVTDPDPLIRPPAIAPEFKPWLTGKASPAATIVFSVFSLVITLLGSAVLAYGRQRRGKGAATH